MHWWVKYRIHPNTMLFEVMVGIMEEKMEKNKIKDVSCWRSLEAKFLIREFEIIQEIQPLKNLSHSSFFTKITH